MRLITNHRDPIEDEAAGEWWRDVQNQHERRWRRDTGQMSKQYFTFNHMLIGDAN